MLGCRGDRVVRCLVECRGGGGGGEASKQPASQRASEMRWRVDGGDAAWGAVGVSVVIRESDVVVSRMAAVVVEDGLG